MRLIVPVLSEALLLLKSRRNPKLVRKVQAVHRDGETYQQAYWVLPKQAVEEDMPAGAQLDLFDQVPSKPVKKPFPDIYLSKKPEDDPDEYTAKMRKLAADMAAYRVPPSVKFDGNRDVPYNYLRAAFGDSVSKGVYGLPPNAAAELLTSLSLASDVSWEDARKRLLLLASGEVGVYSDTHGKYVRSKYHNLPVQDLVRLYLGLKHSGDAEYSYQANRLYDEMWRRTHSGYRDMLHYAEIHESKKLMEIAAGRASFAYKIGRKKYIFKAALSNNVHAEEAVIQDDPVAQVKDMIARGAKTYEDFLRIGKVIYQAVGLEEDDTIKRLEKNREESWKLYDIYKRKSAKVQKMYWNAPRNRLSDESYANEIDAFKAELDKWVESEYNPKMTEYRKEEERIKEHIQKKNEEDKAEEILDFMAKVRPMGPEKVLDVAMFRYTNADAPMVVKKAMSVFPSDWLKALDGKPVLFSKGEGTCQWSMASGFNIKASWDPLASGHTKATQAHEIGHAIERSNGLAEACRQFVYSLADESNGGAVKGKKTAMRSWQKGLQSDHLPEAYCGVLYDWGDTEVMSMAAGALYDDHKGNLYRGRRYWEFILGLWAGA